MTDSTGELPLWPELLLAPPTACIWLLTFVWKAFLLSLDALREIPAEDGWPSGARFLSLIHI